jgi:hypothetical protein
MKVCLAPKFLFKYSDYFIRLLFLGKLVPAKIGDLYKRITDEINTTFAIQSTEDLSF